MSLSLNALIDNSGHDELVQLGWLSDGVSNVLSLKKLEELKLDDSVFDLNDVDFLSLGD